MLQHAHPAKFVAEILGVILGTYFLWINNWIGAVISSVILFLGSTIALWNKPSRCRLLPLVIAPSLGLEKIVPLSHHDHLGIGFLCLITSAAMKATPRR